jgi:thiamine biosynthesis protein thiS|uniref:sulfur carrier protein ThiS n=1 Tax=Candidatus Cryptobacteroides bacterium TaxID=3085639 RepID=UPI004024D362
MNVTVNNKPVETGASTLKELALQLELPEKGVAVAVSNKMVPRSEWENFAITEGVSIIVIRASCGG